MVLCCGGERRGVGEEMGLRFGSCLRVVVLRIVSPGGDIPKVGVRRWRCLKVFGSC